MTVIEVVKKFDLAMFEKSYQNQYGNVCNYTYDKLDEFFSLKVKGIKINFPTNHVTITVIEEAK